MGPVMEQVAASSAQATIEFLKGHLDALRSIIDSESDPVVRASLEAQRENVRNFLCALTLDEDPEYLAAMHRFAEHLATGASNKRARNVEDLGELLGD